MDLQYELGEWYPYLKDEFTRNYMEKVGRVIGYHKDRLQPSLENVFRAFRSTAPKNIKAIAVGQDPYCNYADGLAFSCHHTVPYSLKEIFKELEVEGFGTRSESSLDDWADQGVLLLNSYLTTITGKVKAHEELGWKTFIGEVWKVIKNLPQPIVIMAWGKDAQNRVVLGTNPRLLLKSDHPAASRYSDNGKVPFIGNNHFTRCNQYLIRNKIKPIEWITEQTGVLNTPNRLEGSTSSK